MGTDKEDILVFVFEAASVAEVISVVIIHPTKTVKNLHFWSNSARSAADLGLRFSVKCFDG